METINFLMGLVVYLTLPAVRHTYLSPNNFLITGPKADLAYAESVAIGTRLGLEECHHQFRWELWNCPLQQPQALLSHQPTPVTRELSFAQAISCSGVAYTVTRDCSHGRLVKCQCDESRLGEEGGYNWEWGGCSANLRFGEHVSRMFMDERESATDVNAKVKLHNNEAGRRALRKTVELICKCHGISGSCSTKTCWHKLPEFHMVGNYLKGRYRRAIYVSIENGALRNTRRQKRKTKIGLKDLLYLQESPDYCTYNGTYSTLGRECLRSGRGSEGPAGDRRKNPHTKSCQRLCRDCGLKLRLAMPAVRLFLVGDVMLARGIDMIQRHSCDPTLFEGNGLDAHGYVELAVATNGPLPVQRSPSYIWGDTLRILDEKKPDLKIINLETSVTTSDRPWPGKGIHYRMHPKNVDVIQAAGVDCCVLSNNHTADWGYGGLKETLNTLKEARIEYVGAGFNTDEAQTPAVFDIPGKTRVLIFGVGHPSSGIPVEWGAQSRREGLCLLDIERPGKAVSELKRMVKKHRRHGDLVVLSIHWGGNWGYQVLAEQKRFAYGAIDDADVDIVHGHSSHHAKGVEVYKGKLVIYGCGDFINDYEGIGGNERYRGDLAFMYFADVDCGTGHLRGLTMVPTQTRKLSVNAASDVDTQWLVDVMRRECQKLGCDVRREGSNLILVTE